MLTKEKNKWLDLIVLALLGSDLLLVLADLVLAHWLRFSWGGLPESLEPVQKLPLAAYQFQIGCGAISLIWLLSSHEVYHPLRLLRYRSSSVGISRACTIWFLGYLGFALVLKINPPLSRMFMIFAYALCLTTLLLWHWIVRFFFLKSDWGGLFRRRVVVVGWNDLTLKLYRAILRDQAHAYEVVGAVPAPGDRFYRSPPGEVACLGGYGELPEIFVRQDVEIVILADLEAVKGEVLGLANLCEKNHIQFNILPHYFPILSSGLKLETISNIPVMGIKDLPFDSFFNRLLKRAVDVCGAVVGLIMGFPVMLVAAVLIQQESRGSVFYRQVRVGRRGRQFSMIKLRSMKLDAEAGGVGWTQKNDPRRLKVGAFLREWNLDELPQFWNVLKGEMSLVGPRPERPELIQQFEGHVPHYHARHSCKPGMTGWAQVNGLRGDTELTERVQYDLFYLENWSIWLDFYIMLQTFYRRQNAY